LKYNQLIDLNLSGNLLTGAIPNFDGIPNLKTLTLSRNALVGPVPNFQRFPHLQRMTIDHNKLNGELPDFTNLPSLRDMDLSFNQLSGKIPLMARLTVKSKVDLTHNNLNFNGLDAHIGLGTGLDKTYDIFYANQNPAALKKSGNLLFFDAGDETPNMQYTWYKNDTVLLLNQRNGSSLFISSSGDYKCVATNLAVGGFSVSSTREKAVYKPEDEIVMKTETASSLYQNRLKLGGAINVAIPRQGKYIFKLMDSQNKEILKSDQNISFSQRKACSFSLTGVPVGFYYLKVTGPNNYQTYYHFAIE
jgi:Leucine-rich repeat (LRR) protein